MVGQKESTLLLPMDARLMLRLQAKVDLPNPIASRSSCSQSGVCSRISQCFRASCDDFLEHMTMHIREPAFEAVVVECEAFVV